MSSVPRKPAPRHAKPAQRHFARKGPTELQAGDDSSDEDEQQQEIVQEGHDEEIGAYGGEIDAQSFVTQGRVPERGAKPLKVALGNVQVQDGRVIIDGQVESGKTLIEQQKEQETSESESEEEEEEESSEEESESEEEPPKPQLRPVFVSKHARETIKERDEMAFDSEEAIKKREAAAEERKQQSRSMVGETIKKGLAEKEAQHPGKEIDDTDGLDPEGEFNAWRMRELMRLKREKEEEKRREEERLEIERRRAMPEEQRMKEDLERAQKLRDEKPKMKQPFLQKYWHKGAFYQDMSELKNRDFSQRAEGQVDVSLLPKVMQVKDFGKRSRTKYTHLKDQDTSLSQPPKSQQGNSASGPFSEGCFLCGGPHLKKDCPQSNVPPGQGQAGTGSNVVDAPKRRWGDSGRRDSEWRERSHDRDRHPNSHSRDDYRRDRYRDDDYRRRSRSPGHQKHHGSTTRTSRRHSRSASPDRSRRSRSPKRRRHDY
ncbi:hypothetical protein CPB86DRAFT_778063 [Serendipita vermifera]|nr:hypothetical protein CPB86DRAFT_778063 [Serendipita vermifera]